MRGDQKRRRLSAHLVAYLRAVGDGLGLDSLSERYLQGDGATPPMKHQQVVDLVRAYARRKGERDWRLIGMVIPQESTDKHPTLDEFVQTRGLEDWSEAEIREMYLEAYPHDWRATRRAGMRERQRALLDRMMSAPIPLADEAQSVGGWFDPKTTQRLESAGLATLGALRRAIARSRLWYRAVAAVGKRKAGDIQRRLEDVLPPTEELRFPIRVTGAPENPGKPETPMVQAPYPAPAPNAIDVQTMQAWIAVSARSPATAKAYQTQASRFLLWLSLERGGRRLQQVGEDDINQFLDFLALPSPAWIGKAAARPTQSDWAPLRGPLKPSSVRQAQRTIHAFLAWRLKHITS